MIDDTVFKVVLMVAASAIGIFVFFIAIILIDIRYNINEASAELSYIKYYVNRVYDTVERINNHSMDIYAETSTILKINAETRNALKTTNEKLEKIRKQIDKR